MPGHPEVTVPFDDLIKDEREGERTTRVTVNGMRIKVRIAELLNGVESPDERARRAQKEEWFGGVNTIIYVSALLCVITSNNTSVVGRFTDLSEQS